MSDTQTTETIRYSKDGSINMVHNAETGEFRIATQDDMDTLQVGEDLTDEEIALLDE